MQKIKVFNTADIILKDHNLIFLLMEQMRCLGVDSKKKEMLETVKRTFTAEKRTFLMVLYADAQAIGFAFYNLGTGLETNGDYIWLNELHIKKNARGNGYGKKLLVHLEYWAKQQHIKKIFGIANAHSNVLNFYEQAGFDVSPVNWIERVVDYSSR